MSDSIDRLRAATEAANEIRRLREELATVKADRDDLSTFAHRTVLELDQERERVRELEEGRRVRASHIDGQHREVLRLSARLARAEKVIEAARAYREAEKKCAQGLSCIAEQMDTRIALDAALQEYDREEEA